MALSLAACGGSSSTTTTSTNTTTTTTPEAVSLTVGIDSVTTGAGDDTINGSPVVTTAGGGAATNDVFTALDSIDGGAGSDALNITQVGNFTIPAGATVVNVETANITSGGTVVANTTAWTGLTALNSSAVGASTLTAAATTNVSAVNATLGAANSVVDGGDDVTVTVTGMGATASGDGVDVGSTTAATGDVVVSATAATGTAALTMGAIEVNGGDTITVTTAAAARGNASNAVTQSAIDINGDAQTTAVTVSQSAEAAAVAATPAGAVANGTVAITDGNAATASDTITTVTLVNHGTATIDSTVLATLNVTGGATSALESGAITIDKTSSDTSTAATTLNLNGSGFIGALDGTQTDVYTTVNISASSAFTIADVNLAAATSVNASGAGVTTISALTDVSSVTSFTSTGGGLKIGAGIGNAVTFTGSDGTDSVLVGATTKAISMGAGNDSVTMSAALGTGGSISGGTGDDTLVLNVIASTFSDPAAEPRITGFENLSLGALSNGSYNAAGFTKLSQGNTAAAVTYANVAAGADLTITATSQETLDVVLADATGTADVFGITFSSTGAIDYTASSSDITIAGVETINITTTDTNTTAHVNDATLTAAAAKTVTISGNTGFDLAATGSTAVTTFDASGVVLSAVTATGVTYDSVNTTVGENVTIKGSNGVDVLTGDAASNDTIISGSGADTVVYNGGSDVFTLGAGADTVLVNVDGTATVHLTVTDLAVGDKVDVTGVADATNDIADGAIGAITALGAGATLAQYLDASAAGTGGATTSTADWFQFGGDTYLVIDNSNAATFAATDSVVEFEGLIDLSTSTFATEVLTIVAV